MKKIFLTVAIVALTVVLASCGGASTPAPVDIGEGASDDDIAKALSSTYFSGVKVDMFTYGDAEADLGKVKTIALPAVKACLNDDQFKALSKKGYKVYVVGHACKYGSKGANYQMGLKRAKQVMYELRAQKVDEKMLGYTSKAGFQMVNDVNGGFPEQRRVTFKVMKKGWTLGQLIKEDKMKNKPKKGGK
jgi:hypothetical protein